MATDPGSTTTERGYGWAHQQERERWRPHVDRGEVNCWRCGQPIRPGSAWHLGHDDHDRTKYRGPEHPACNLQAGGRAGNRAARAARSPHSRDW